MASCGVDNGRVNDLSSAVGSQAAMSMEENSSERYTVTVGIPSWEVLVVPCIGTTCVSLEVSEMILIVVMALKKKTRQRFVCPGQGRENRPPLYTPRSGPSTQLVSCVCTRVLSLMPHVMMSN